MRRVSIVSLIAGGILLGHVVPHLLAPRTGREHVTAPAAVPSAVNAAPAPLVAPNCRLQPPLPVSDREPMLAALRHLIARDERRYPRLTASQQDLRCLEL